MLQLKMWLHGISLRVWRRLLVPSGCTLRVAASADRVARTEAFRVWREQTCVRRSP